MKPESQVPLRRGYEEFCIVCGLELRPGESCMQFCDAPSARVFLRRFLFDHLALARFRDLLWCRGLGSDPTRLDNHEMLNELTRHLVSGRLRVVRTLRPGIPTRTAISQGKGAEEEEYEERPRRRPAAFPEPSRAVEQTNWVKLRVIDDETGSPLSGISLKVRLPAGDIGTLTTSWDGAIELYDLVPGTLDVLEMLDKEALEVVAVE